MSDFLSNFTKKNYDGQKKEEKKAATVNPSEKAEKLHNQESESTSGTNSRAEPQIATQEKAESETAAQPSRSRRAEEVSRFGKEETEFDPTYKKRQRKKYGMIGASILLVIALLGFVYYALTHVKVPDFVEQNVADVRSWGAEEGVVIKVDQVYDFEVAENKVISQSVAPDKKIKKGKSLTIKASMGADPDEALELPDFATMDKEQADTWIKENKAENISLIEQFDENVEKNKFIKVETANKELDLSQYKRKDRMSVYYSKGKETFEKNIEVPDFIGKTTAEVSEWAKKNGVRLKEEKLFSDSVAAGSVISQGIAKGTKVAKNDELPIQISKGKAIVVPDFSQYTMEQASAMESTLPINVKTIYADGISYGSFISQSEEAGKEYGETDVMPTVQVVYSLGLPYMKDLRGQTNEGDLPKLFFDEYRSKGACIYYEVYYVDSSEPKGTVVEMSRYGEFLPLEATISLGISRGNLKSTTPESPVTQGASDLAVPDTSDDPAADAVPTKK